VQTERMNGMLMAISSSVHELDKKNKNKDSAAFKRGGASAVKQKVIGMMADSQESGVN
jgi:uncharacterized membrane protein